MRALFLSLAVAGCLGCSSKKSDTSFADKVDDARKEINAADEKRALERIAVLLQACEAYKMSPANQEDEFPSKLDELISPPWGGGGFLKGGKMGLLDPWGEPFKYALVKGKDGKPVPYVWSERTVDGKVKVVGTKP